jgi:UDP-N-acetylglucosamine 4-epimerase
LANSPAITSLSKYLDILPIESLNIEPESKQAMDTYNLEEYELDSIKGKRVLVTGGAGFIGSNLTSALLNLGAGVRVMDNLETGFLKNISAHGEDPNFDFLEGSINNADDCAEACKRVEVIVHLAALGSVPRSINDPLRTNECNISGFLNVLWAAKNAGIKRIVYASSSSVYGDNPQNPKAESDLGNLLSPYAVSKYANELYASVFAKHYGLELIGLRFFNVFGPRQDPKGAYAAVIPIFIQSLIENKPVYINGDGSISRDFTYIDNVIQIIVKACTTTNKAAINQVYNAGCGNTYSLNTLYDYLAKIMEKDTPPIYREERPGDIRNSMANIQKAAELLEYKPHVGFFAGLEKTVEWFAHHQAFIKKTR